MLCQTVAENVIKNLRDPTRFELEDLEIMKPAFLPCFLSYSYTVLS